MTRARFPWTVRTLLALSAVLVPCGALAADQTVQVGPGLSFSPTNVTVAPGEMVTWEFHELHTSTSDSQSGPEAWDSGMRTSGTFSHTFNSPGTYPYYCGVHSFPGGTMMNGVVEVSGGGATPTPTTTPTSLASPTQTPTSPAPPTATPTSLASPTQTPTSPALSTPTATPISGVPTTTPIGGPPAAGIPDLGAGGRLLLAVTLAGAGLAVLLFLQRR
jgi:plastocyanin